MREIHRIYAAIALALLLSSCITVMSADDESEYGDLGQEYPFAGERCHRIGIE